MLRQLGNIFIVQPDVLKSYITESFLGRIDARLLRPYLMQRSDWSTFARKFNEEAGPDPSAEAAGEAGNKTSRLSLGAGKLRDLARSIEAHAIGDGGFIASGGGNTSREAGSVGKRNTISRRGGAGDRSSVIMPYNVST